MKKTISLDSRKAGALVLVLVLGLAVEVANADFTFGEPVNLGPPINSPSREVAFIVSADGLEMYVSSERSGGLGYIDMWRRTRENADDPWGPLVNVQGINSRYNEVFPSLSADGLILYFSDWYAWNDAGDRPGGVGGHDLWMSTRASRNEPWGPSVNVGAPLNSGSHEISPTISHDGRTFIFASKRSGGLGDYDLWMSTRPAAESDWAPPVNMGPTVNSSAYDAEAYLSADGLTLLFCSNRPGGMGSYDIWLTTRANQAAAWSPPVNLGPPINTSGMEGMASLSPDQKTLYFGTGDWEVYEAPIVPIVDFNGDGKIDFKDFCELARYWSADESSVDIGPLPLGDYRVDYKDLAVFTDYWLTGSPPGQASNPHPANYTEEVDINDDLSWTAGTGATSCDVYFGKSDPGTFQGNQTHTTFDPCTMTYGTTYYWRIDVVNAWGKTTGIVWNFTTIYSDLQARNPNPSNGAIGVNTTADLNWTAGVGATSHDVYFGTSNPPPFLLNRVTTTFDPGTMAYSTKYYWRIDEVDAYGTTTGTVWSFTTMMSPPPP
jgi:hypothetical protein